MGIDIHITYVHVPCVSINFLIRYGSPYFNSICDKSSYEINDVLSFGKNEMVQLFTIFRHHHQQHLYNDILWIKEFINKPVNFLSRADHDGSSQLSWLKFVLCLSSSLSSLSSSKTFDIFIFTLFSRSTGPISLSLAQRILRWSKFKCTQMMYDWLVVHCIMSRINIFILFISRRHNCQWRATQREIIAKSWK